MSDGFSYDLSFTVAPVDHDGDPGTAPVDSCTSVTIDNVMSNGSALTDAGTYNVTVNSFLADGGDNFDTLGEVTSTRYGGGNDLDALIAYFGANSPVAPPGTDRVNEVSIPAAAD